MHSGVMQYLVLEGMNIRLEALDGSYIEGLSAAAAFEPSLYCWSPVPQRKEETTAYINAAVASKEAGTAIPFAIVRTSDNVVIGSTRFWNLERWSWPSAHPSHDRSTPDACEIGYTWLPRSAIRSGANTEAKFLMLKHAFESWQVLRVCFHTDSRNLRSRAALERIGA